MAITKTSIASHGEIDREPSATYGIATTRRLLRIGNGGAGATGLIEALALDYLKTVPAACSIDWVCNHSRNTQLALFNDFVDLALTYERDQEELAASEGWSVTAGCVFHDHFVLSGPASDPANLRSAASLSDAFLRIAQTQARFFSRADSSATMFKERSIWSSVGLSPWADPAALDRWYHTNLHSPAAAVMAADAAKAYLLTDRSTLLRQTALRTVHSSTVFFEPTAPDDILMNSCNALVPARSQTKQAAETTKFVTYLFSDAGQNVIASFGKEELGGFPLFASVRDGFATTSLSGGSPRDGRWTLSTA